MEKQPGTMWQRHKNGIGKCKSDRGKDGSCRRKKERTNATWKEAQMVKKWKEHMKAEGKHHGAS